MCSRSENDHRDIVLEYFRLIDEKDMDNLLSLFTDDCTIYEPFSKWDPSNHGYGMDKTLLKGRSEIESFLNIVMMASDGLKHEIEFVDDAVIYNKQLTDINTSESSTIVTALATFYRNSGGAKLKGKLTFNIISNQGNNKNDIINNNNHHHYNRRIKTLWIQFCTPPSASIT